MAPSDVANVRDAAWSPEYELEMDTGFQTSWGEDRGMQVEFDASAVFERNAFAIQTSVLAEAEALLSGVADEAVPCSDADGASNIGDGTQTDKG